MVSEKKISKVFHIVSLGELYVAMATRVPIQSALNLKQPFPQPDKALHDI